MHRQERGPGQPSQYPRSMPEIAGGTRHDVVMTPFGCRHGCRFCFGRMTGLRYIPLSVVEEDLSRRKSGDLDVGDAIAPSVSRWREHGPVLASSGKRFSWELRVGDTTTERLQLLHECGAVRVRLGIESAISGALSAMGKRHTDEQAREAVARAHLSGSSYLRWGHGSGC